MGSFGERLRREREMRGITVEEIAEATKIGSRSLQALEEEQFDRLPGGIFNKGFVRSYARYLGLDEEQAVADYVAAESTFRGGVPESDAEPEPRDDLAKRSLAAIAVILLLVAGLVAGVYGWKAYGKDLVTRAMHHSNRPKVETAASALPTETSKPQTPVQKPVATGTAPGDLPPSAAPSGNAAAAPSPRARSTAPEMKPAADTAPAANIGDGFVVQLKAREDSWISVNADGKSVMSGTLKPAAERTVRAHDRLVVKLGNAGAMDVSYNGRAVELAASPANHVKTLVFTAQGLQP